MKLRRRLENWRKKVIFIFTVVGCCTGFFVCFFYIVILYCILVVMSLRVPSRCKHTFPPHLQFFPVFLLQILEACLVVFAGCLVAKANFPRGGVCLWLMPTRFHERYRKKNLILKYFGHLFKTSGISGSRFIYLYIQYILSKPRCIIYLRLLWQDISKMSSSLEYVIRIKLGPSECGLSAVFEY